VPGKLSVVFGLHFIMREKNKKYVLFI
jgi:CRISPR-associated helicase, Cas3 family